MLEREIEKKVCDYAKSKGMLHYKFSSPAHLGVPDRIFFAPAGRVFLIEFKREGGKPTPSQEREAARIGMMSIDVYLIDNVEEGKAVVDQEYATSQQALAVMQFAKQMMGGAGDGSETRH